MQKIIKNGWSLNVPHDVVDFVDEARSCNVVHPDENHVFRAFELTPYDKVRVVILGQDPYHTPGVADGLAFSTQKEGYMPPSVRNMFKELDADLGIKRTNPDLSDWAWEGVLLLNTSLTVNEGVAYSHKGVWDKFIDDVIVKLNNHDSTIVFVLLGNHAKKYKKKINTKHTILEFTHPSPLSASRGYFGSKMFSKINESLDGDIKWGSDE